ncbi:MAG: hypothetical protein D6725_07580 [Planctomycetota bacterium]|nr:MAG: hypothetical protein D6725_07580 [Planctomycetota bacterium]
MRGREAGKGAKPAQGPGRRELRGSRRLFHARDAAAIATWRRRCVGRQRTGPPPRRPFGGLFGEDVAPTHGVRSVRPPDAAGTQPAP